MARLPILAREEAGRLLEQDVVRRIWRRDPAVWVGDAADEKVKRAISQRLGWLDAPDQMLGMVDEVVTFARNASEAGFRLAYLIGIGGSSLAAEVIVSSQPTKGLAIGVLDTTDEQTIDGVLHALAPERTLFIVASKSGGTIEVRSAQRIFEERITASSPAGSIGPRFAAVTDPGSPLDAWAISHGYRHTFLNPPDIGGRFSALSLFGLVPAALAGADVGTLLDSGRTMARACQQSSVDNPGLLLGAFLGAGVSAGRDKLTLIISPELAALGAWIEQLVAESTGKRNTGILPVVAEPVGRPEAYGDDRVFVSIETSDSAVESVKPLEAAGHPVFRIRTRGEDLGAEFFRWEFATAVAGAVLQLNPFDEPNVQESKDLTRKVLDSYEQAGSLPEGEPLVTDGKAGVRVYGSCTLNADTPADCLQLLFDSLRPGDYVGLLSYLSPSAATASLMAQVRGAIRERWHVATTIGLGPRYLHSTGQYYKGGPDRGVFLILTADDRTETPVPDTTYSLAILKRAQAIGDLRALQAHGRRVVRVHLETTDAAPALGKLFEQVFSRDLSRQ